MSATYFDINKRSKIINKNIQHYEFRGRKIFCVYGENLL